MCLDLIANDVSFLDQNWVWNFNLKITDQSYDVEIAFDKVGLVGKKKSEFELYSDSERLSVDYGYYLCVSFYIIHWEEKLFRFVCRIWFSKTFEEDYAFALPLNEIPI